MVQLNRAERVRGGLVGLHYHLRQADCWYVVAGRAAVVLVDLRLGSPTQGAVLHDALGEDDHGVYIPPGVAHGIAALTDITLIYLQDRNFDAADELDLAWDDPELDIAWPITAPILSDRDRSAPRLADIPLAALPRYGG